MPSIYYRPGDAVRVKDCNGTFWPATYKGDAGPRDPKGAIIEINGSRTRAELHNIVRI